MKRCVNNYTIYFEYVDLFDLKSCNKMMEVVNFFQVAEFKKSFLLLHMGEKMVVRETVLLPKLQYIIRIIKTEALQDAIQHIKKFIALQKELNRDSSNQLMELIVEWLRLYDKDKKQAEEGLEEYIAGQESCKQCFCCYQCIKLFWIEVYHIFYSDKYTQIKKEIEGKNILVFDRLPNTLYKDIDAKSDVSEHYWRQCIESRKQRNNSHQLVLLKGMSSSTPAIMNGAFGGQNFHGGGFFLYILGKGIAIDPGYHFVDNLHKAGYTIYDVDIVVITHEHIDHSNDIRVLDDLNHSIYNKTVANGIGHKIDWYVDAVTYDVMNILQSHKSGFSAESNNIYKILPDTQRIMVKENVEDDGTCIKKENSIPDEGIAFTNNIKCRVIRNYHEKQNISSDGYYNHTFAIDLILCLDRKVRKIFYTSDTRYFLELCKEAEDSDVIIANISSVYEDDLLKIKQKATHMGYYGCYSLLKGLESKPPKYFVLSEFWNAKSDMRYDIAKFLKEELENENTVFKHTNIIPAEIGMKLDIEQLKMKCSFCGGYSENIKVIRPYRDYEEIKCICDNCCF